MPPTPLTVSQILALADSHHRMTGAWPHGEDRQVSEQLVQKIEPEEKALAESKS